MNFTEHHFSAADGLRLYYRAYGPHADQRPAVLCLPGLTRNSKDFHDLATRLSAKGRRVICPDMRGRGQSAYDPDKANYDPVVYLEDLRHLMAVEGLHRVVVVGTSLGGILGMALAVKMPMALAGLVMNDVGPEVGGKSLGRIIRYIEKDRPQPDWISAAHHLREVFPPLSLSSDEDWLKMARHTYREGDDGVLHFDWDIGIVEPLKANPNQRHDLWPLFKALGERPVLALRGGVSDVLDEDCFARMGQTLGQITCVTVPDVGHVPILDEPIAEAAIDAFFERI